jgi:hypothetical protein
MPKQTPPSMMPSSNAHKRRKKYKTNYVQVRRGAFLPGGTLCAGFVFRARISTPSLVLP